MPKFLETDAEKFLGACKNVGFLTKGWRGNIYTSELDGKKVIIKVARSPELSRNILKEAEILKIVNQEGIGPHLLLYGYDFVVEEFVEGVTFDKVIDSDEFSAQRKIFLFLDILKQARKLDILKISKNEMHRPYKNVILSKKGIVLIDFESATFSQRPKNVTQVFSFIVSFLKRNFFMSLIKEEEAIKIMKEYKRTYSSEAYNKILDFIFSLM